MIVGVGDKQLPVVQHQLIRELESASGGCLFAPVRRVFPQQMPGRITDIDVICLPVDEDAERSFEIDPVFPESGAVRPVQIAAK